MICALLRTGGVEAPRLRQKVVRRLDGRFERFGRRGRRDGLVAVLNDGTARLEGVQGSPFAKHAKQSRGADDKQCKHGALHCYDYELCELCTNLQFARVGNCYMLGVQDDDDQPLSERRLLENSQKQYRNALIRRASTSDACLRAACACQPVLCALGKRSVHDAYTSSRRARKRTQWFRPLLQFAIENFSRAGLWAPVRAPCGMQRSHGSRPRIH